MTENKKEVVASRVAVLDSAEFDNEVYGILKHHVNAITAQLPLGSIAKYEPEIDALLKTLLWMLSVERTCSTFGQQLLHLKYEDRTPLYKLRFLGFLRIGIAYLRDKLSGSPQESMNRLMDKLNTVLNLFNLLTFISFLKKGGPATFFESFLGLIPVSTVRPSERSIGYGYMTRELVWHSLIELLGMIVPLVSWSTMKRLYRKATKSKTTPSSGVPYSGSVDATVCALCKESPILPHTMGCMHAFCYYCLSSQIVVDSKFECPSCGYYTVDAAAFMTPVKSRTPGLLSS